VEEIADQVGFRSPQYFTTRFRKAFGITPSDFRAR
ncbi:MAG: AraC family transcriptional regulator, partial [Rhodothermales bacterium]|nr:AraC family transcriptional regulator [Rhodothermales bacterium]